MLALALATDASTKGAATDASTKGATTDTDDMRLGIVTTWRGLDLDTAHSWIKYHVAVGFSR